MSRDFFGDTSDTPASINLEQVDMVNAPPHYTCFNPNILEVLEGWDLGFYRSIALQYIVRAEKKGEAVQDLEKAIFYLKRQIGVYERSSADPVVTSLLAEGGGVQDTGSVANRTSDY